MANRRNNRKSRRNKKRRINKKKLTLLFIVVILFIAGAFKLTQGAISTIKNTSNNKKQTSVVESSKVVESSDNEYETLQTEVDKNINKKSFTQSTPNIAEKLDNEMVAFLDTEFLTSQIKGGPPAKLVSVGFVVCGKNFEEVTRFHSYIYASSSALWLTSVPSPQRIFRLPIPALCRSSFAE